MSRFTGDVDEDGAGIRDVGAVEGFGHSGGNAGEDGCGGEGAACSKVGDEGGVGVGLGGEGASLVFGCF